MLFLISTNKVNDKTDIHLPLLLLGIMISSFLCDSLSQPLLTHGSIALSTGAKAVPGSRPGRQTETLLLLSQHRHEVLQVCISTQ